MHDDFVKSKSYAGREERIAPGVVEPLEPMPGGGLEGSKFSTGFHPPDTVLQSEIEYLSIAWMLTIGLTPDEIETHLEKPPGFVFTLRSKHDFQIILTRCLEIKANCLVSQAGSAEGLLDGQILSNIATLMQIRDNPFSKDTARLKATIDMLDRAPEAPKVRREVEQRQTIIALPVSSLMNMQQALLEQGAPEDLKTIELLRGVDYNVDNNIENKSGEEDDEIEAQIPVDRVEW